MSIGHFSCLWKRKQQLFLFSQQPSLPSNSVVFQSLQNSQNTTCKWPASCIRSLGHKTLRNNAKMTHIVHVANESYKWLNRPAFYTAPEIISLCSVGVAREVSSSIVLVIVSIHCSSFLRVRISGVDNWQLCVKLNDVAPSVASHNFLWQVYLVQFEENLNRTKYSCLYITTCLRKVIKWQCPSAYWILVSLGHTKSCEQGKLIRNFKCNFQQ